jgi:APA family basic amino acid/polyamine antiporter
MSQLVEHPPSPAAPAGGESPPPALGLGDAVSIIVGIVVGAGIYQTAPFIFKHVSTPQMALAFWGVAGALSFIGALCYAELATTYPRDGGDIVYLNRAFGRWCGFLFGWVQLTVILTGSIGMMAFVFANYAIRLCKDGFGMDLGILSAFAFAGGAILLLTLTNILGVVFGKVVQNVLTVAKVIGLGAIIVAGFMAPMEGAWEETSLPLQQLRDLTFPFFEPSIGVALVLILYTYGGWNDAAFVAAEVKDAKRNMTLALVLGILLITVLYILVNYAYINALGYHGAQRSSQIAADVLNRGFGKGGVALMCVLVMVSALGAVNGLIFTGARVYAKIGQDYSILSWMGGWSIAKGSPVPALITQGVLALLLVFLVGTNPGRDAVNALLDLTATGSEHKQVKDEKTGELKWVTDRTGHFLKPMQWDDPRSSKKEYGPGEEATELAKGGFDTLVTCTAPIFWGFFLLTGISLFVLRERDRDIERPFKVPFYPTLPLIFCVTCGYMLYSAVAYALVRDWKGGLVLLGLLPLLLGLPLYHLSQAMGDAKRAESS